MVSLVGFSLPHTSVSNGLSKWFIFNCHIFHFNIEANRIYSTHDFGLRSQNEPIFLVIHMRKEYPLQHFVGLMSFLGFSVNTFTADLRIVG